MPYYSKKRRYAGKKRRRRVKNPAYNSSNSTLRNIGNIAGTALNIAKFAASVLNVEEKYLVTDFNASANISNSPSIVVNQVPQGTDNTQRIGRQIRGKALHWRCNFTMNPTPEQQYLRYVILIDKKTDGTNFPLTNYITHGEEISFRNHDFLNRFHTIRQNVITFVKNGANRALHVEEYIDLSKLPKELQITEYDGTGATIADISAHPIYILLLTSSAVGQEIDVRSRVKYTFVDN